MIETRQFLQWLVRKIFQSIMFKPVEFFKSYVRTIHRHGIIPMGLGIFGSCAMGTAAGLIAQGIIGKELQSDIPNYVAISVICILSLIPIAAGIGALFKEFKKDQQRIIDALRD